MILSKGRVLLVDDEPLVLEMFESILTERGYDVFVAPNAQTALSHLEKSFFDVLVCDVLLEDLDGFDIMTIARKKHPGIATVLITGAPSEPDAEKAANQGAAYLSKPIGFDLLISTIQNCIESVRIEQGKQRANV